MSLLKEIMSSIGENILARNGVIHFHRIQDLITQFLKQNQQDGCHTPLVLDVKISKESIGYKVNATAYYKSESENDALVKSYEKKFKDISNIPSRINKKLGNDGNIEIRIKDILELMLNQNKVNETISFKDLETIKNQLKKESNLKQIRFCKITIEDNFFKKSISVLIEGQNNNFQKKFSVQDISDIPQDVEKALLKKGKVILSFD